MNTHTCMYSHMQLGYEVDAEHLNLFPTLVANPSRVAVAYQLLADRKSTLRKLPLGSSTSSCWGSPGARSRQYETAAQQQQSNAAAAAVALSFTFARDVQKRLAIASCVIGHESTPFHWASDLAFRSSGSTTASPLVSPNKKQQRQ